MNENGVSASSLLLSFITTTYNMVDDPSSDSIISWSQNGKSFIIWNPKVFHRDLLRKFFKTINNLDFFFSNLDTLRFRKIDSGKWEFANDNFVRGQPQLMMRDQLYQRMDMRDAMRLFWMQVKEVEQHTGAEMFGIDEPHHRVLSILLLFLTKAYEMVDDPSSDEMISWSESGKSFIIWNPQEFYKYLLPRLFKTRHIYLFFYQLERYGFRKVDTEKWEFANDNFVRGQPQLVENIRSNHRDQLSKQLDRRAKMRNAKGLFKLQVKEVGLDEHERASNSLPSMRNAAKKKTRDATEVKEPEVRLQHIGICKL